jgi:hypothetical protein
MEVHSHPHTERKKWTHYLWEFLMLFLAVFAGFLAEYKLEHVIEHDKEKQYIRSLIADLKENDKMISQELIIQENRIVMMDSMITILNNPARIHGNEGLLYYLARVSPRLGNLTVNNSTFEQLKNSGNFRLIRKIETSNRIMAYYENIPLIRQLEELYQKEFDQYKILASRIFDPVVFSSMEMKNGKIIRTDKNPPLQSYDLNIIKQFSVFAVYMNGSGRGILQGAVELKRKGEAMIDYLQKEYHLE